MRQLSLQRRIRSGSSNRREVSFQDLVVSGRSLYDELCHRGYDYVSCIGWLPEGFDAAARARLLLEAPGDLPSRRCALYICPECADLGCGAISALVSREQDVIVWSGFGYENNYEEGFVPEEQLGPFSFNAQQYFEALRTAT